MRIDSVVYFLIVLYGFDRFDVFIQLCICYNDFETKNLRIRKFETQDAQQLYENHLEEKVKKWIPNESYADIEETRGAIGFYADCVNNKHLPFVLAVELKENGELIGDTGINEVDGNSNEVEIGYTICQKYRGNGYATELVQEMTKYTCEIFGVNILHGRVIWIFVYFRRIWCRG